MEPAEAKFNVSFPEQIPSTQDQNAAHTPSAATKSSARPPPSPTPKLDLYSPSPSVRRFFNWTAEDTRFTAAELKDLLKEFRQSAVRKKLPVKYSQQHQESKQAENDKETAKPTAQMSSQAPAAKPLAHSKSFDEPLALIRSAGKHLQSWLIPGASSSSASASLAPPETLKAGGNGGVSDIISVTVLPLNVFKRRLLGLESFFQVHQARRAGGAGAPPQSAAASAWSMAASVATLPLSLASTLTTYMKDVQKTFGGGDGKEDEEELHISMLPDMSEAENYDAAKKLFKSHMHSRLQNFLADLLFLLLHGPLFSGFTVTAFLAACELLMKSTIDERREWWFYVMRYAARRRLKAEEHDKPWKAQPTADALLTLRTVFGLPLPMPAAFLGVTGVNNKTAASIKAVYPSLPKKATPVPLSDVDAQQAEEKAKHGKDEVQSAPVTDDDELLQLAQRDDIQLSALKARLRQPPNSTRAPESSVSQAPLLSGAEREKVLSYESALLAALQAMGPLVAVAVFVNLLTSRPIHLPLRYQLPDGSVMQHLASTPMHFSLSAFHHLSAVCLTIFLHCASFRVLRAFRADLVHDNTYAHPAPPGPLRFHADEVNKLKSLFERYSLVYFPVEKMEEQKRERGSDDLQYQQQEQKEEKEREKAEIQTQMRIKIDDKQPPAPASSAVSPPRPSRNVGSTAIAYADIVEDAVAAFEDSDAAERDERAAFYLMSLQGFGHFCNDVLRLRLEPAVRDRAFLNLARAQQEENSRQPGTVQSVHSQLISFQQLLTALSIMQRGTSKERAKFLFDIFADTDGRMSRAQVVEFAGFILNHMRGSKDISPAEVEQTVQFCCQEIQTLAQHKAQPARSAGMEIIANQERFAFAQLYGEVLRWQFRIRMLKLVQTFVEGGDESLAALPSAEKKEDESPKNNEPPVPNSCWPLTPALRERLFGMIRLMVVCFISFGMYAVGNSIGVFASALLTHYDRSNADLGTLGSMQSIGVIPGLFISITLAKKSLNLTMIFNGVVGLTAAILLLVSYWTSSFPLLCISFFIFGVGDNGFLSSLCINRIYPDWLAPAFAVYTSVNAIAVVITSVALPEIVTSADDGLLRSYFYLLAATAISFVAGITHAVLDMRAEKAAEPASTTLTKAQPPVSRLSSELGMLQSLNTLLPFHGELKASSLFSFARMFMSLPVSVYLLLLHSFSSYGAMAVASTYGPQFFTNFYSMDLALSAFLIPGFINLLLIPLSIIFGYFFTNVGHRITSLVLAAFLMVLAFALMFINGSDYLYIPWLSSAMLSVVLSTIRSVGFPALSMLVPFHQVPEVNLLYCLFIMSSQIINPLLASAEVSATGSLETIWNLCVALGAFSAFFSIVVLLYDYRHSGSLLQMKANRRTLSQYFRTRQLKDSQDEKADADPRVVGAKSSEADIV